MFLHEKKIFKILEGENTLVLKIQKINNRNTILYVNLRITLISPYSPNTLRYVNSPTFMKLEPQLFVSHPVLSKVNL